MSNRAVKEWVSGPDALATVYPTLTSDQIDKAKRAENIVWKIGKYTYGGAVIHADSAEHQRAGTDVSFVSPVGAELTVDVKGNVNNNHGFYIETDQTGWLYSVRKKSDMIAHVHVDSETVYMYNRSDMQKWANTYSGKLTYYYKGNSTTAYLRPDRKPWPDFITTYQLTDVPPYVIQLSKRENDGV